MRIRVLYNNVSLDTVKTFFASIGSIWDVHFPYFLGEVRAKDVLFFRRNMTLEDTRVEGISFSGVFFIYRLSTMANNVGGTNKHLVPKAQVCSWRKGEKKMVNLEVLNQVVGKWYDTIPGGRITLLAAGLVLL
jgi:hypothetical protein